MWPYVDKGARNMFAAIELQRQVSVKILNLLSNS
ncbi:unnamed protein product [Arabidopsis lyrata]|nr:unnamed protein product [Arabidopsis lyrata]